MDKFNNAPSVLHFPILILNSLLDQFFCFVFGSNKNG